MQEIITFCLCIAVSVTSIVYIFVRKTNSYSYSDTLIVPDFNDRLENVTAIDYIGSIATLFLVMLNLSNFLQFYKMVHRFDEKLNCANITIYLQNIWYYMPSLLCKIVFASSFALLSTERTDNVFHIVWANILTFSSLILTFYFLFKINSNRQTFYNAGDRVYYYDNNMDSRNESMFGIPGYVMMSGRNPSICTDDGYFRENCRNENLKINKMFNKIAFVLQMFTIIYFLILFASIFVGGPVMDNLRTNYGRYEVLFAGYVFYVSLFIVMEKERIILYSEIASIFFSVLGGVVWYNIVNELIVSTTFSNWFSVGVFIVTLIGLTVYRVNDDDYFDKDKLQKA